MNKIDRKKIQRNWTYLKENIDVKHTSFLDKLFESIFKEDDFERVNEEHTSGDKVDRCLRILFTKTEGYDWFCKALEASEHDFVLEKLQETKIDEKEIQEEEERTVQTVREILHAYYARTDHSSFALKEEIEDDVKYEFSQRQHIWDASWTLLSKVLMEEFPDIIYKRKRRKEMVRGIKRKSDFTSGEEDIGSENEKECQAKKLNLDKPSDAKRSEKDPTSSLPLKERTANGIRAILNAKFVEKGINLSILDTFVEEDVNGEVFCSFTMEETYLLFPRELFPNLSFGQRKRIINIRDEIVQAEENGFTFPEHTFKDSKEAVFHQAEVSENSVAGGSSISDKFRETFRKFGYATKERDSYLFDSILTSENQLTNSMLETVHYFVYETLAEDMVPEWIANISIPFLCSCLNERMNGTIHFGVKVLPNENLLKGNVIGIFANKQKIKRFLYKAVRDAFFEDDFEVVNRCMQPPQFIHVALPGNADKVQVSNKFVVEIDIIPSSSLVQETAFFLRNQPPPKTQGQKRYLYRFKKGTAIPIVLTAEQEHAFMSSKSKFTQERRKQEENRTQTTPKFKDLRQQFLNLFSAGNDELLEEIYPFLFLSPLESDLGEEYVAENFEFLHDIDPSVIFDFDSCSEGKGMFHFVEDHQEKIFKVLTTDTFDKNSEENMGKDCLSNALEDLRTSVIKPWVFCNGYQPIRKDPFKKLAWKQNRSNGFKEAIRFFYGEVPEDRAIVVFLLFSKNYDIMLDAADEVLSKFRDQWILLATNESIANHWKQNLLERESVDRTTLDERCIIGISWKHVNEMI